ncbi:MAG: cellulase family glycosylhydrolase [Acutalibacteraceae bacterium]
MKKFIALLLCFLILVVSASCGGDEKDNNQTTSQKVYNTAFQQATSVIPNTTASQTETETESETQTETQIETVETTVARTGKRKTYKQTSDMRNITSSQLLEEINAGIVLGDSLNANGLGGEKSVEEYETYYGNPVITQELIDLYYNAGFKAVRLPVSWAEHMDENGVIDEQWMARVEEVVNMVLSKNMYCIINSQNDQSWLTTDSIDFDSTKSIFTAMWKSIAERFKKYNDHLLFEAVGELLKAENDKSLPERSDIDNTNTLNKLFVKTVRNTGGNNKKRHLIISTYGSFIDSDSLNGFKAPKDVVKNRLIAKVNVYVPSSFCFDESKANAWGKEEEKQYIVSCLSQINKRFSQLGIPVIIGEFGAVDKGNESARTSYAEYLVSTAYNYYMPCFWWDDGDDFALFDRNNLKEKHKRIIDAIIKNSK